MTDQTTETTRLQDEILSLRAELSKLRDLLRSENQRANSAIDRETTAEQAAIEAEQERDRLLAVAARIQQMADAWEERLPETIRTPAVVSALRAVERVPAAPLPPVVQSPIREQLLNAIDATFCQTLGFGTPEGLLAAYEASRTQTVDRAALRDRIAAALKRAPFKELRVDWSAPNGPLEITALVDDLAGAALAAVLPATTNHDTDTAPAATCSAQYHGPGEDRARLCIRAAQHQRTAHTDEHGFHWSDTVAMYPVADGTFRIGTDVVAGLRRVADETAATETIPVETLARLLSDADVYVNHGDYPGWDDLAESGEQQYRRAACHLLKRLHIAERLPAAGARQDGPQ
ncbi:hypothetical protein GTY88_18405 [Streptomyces sp. SID5926]|nr:hypothetical protein [Streptomyces sp. SID5926]